MNSTQEMNALDHLTQYPDQLAALSHQLLDADIAIRQHQAEVDRLTGLIEQAIVDDSSLKNEQQRKAKRLELFQDKTYQTARIALQQAQDDYQRLKIQRQLIADRFVVAQFFAKERIACLSVAS